MSSPLVTAVVLCFNTGEWVTRTIDSIVNNGYPNLEIICIDDASTDESSQQLLTNFLEETKFGTLILNSSNLGIPKCANIGLQKAKGKYIFLIGDDLILSGKIEKDVECLESSNPDVALVHSIMQYSNFDFSIRYPYFLPTFSYPQTGPDLSTFDKAVKLGGGVAAPTALFKTSILNKIGGWDETLKFEDKPMWLSLISQGFGFEFRPEVSVLYRKNNQQISNHFQNGDLIYQMELYSGYVKYSSAASMMRKILFYAASAKIDGNSDLAECVKIYRDKISKYSVLAFLAQIGFLTMAAKAIRRIINLKFFKLYS